MQIAAEQNASHLFSTVDESLLLRWDPFLLFHPFFNPLHLDLSKNKRLSYKISQLHLTKTIYHKMLPYLWVQCQSLFLFQ